jgi:hypothetical protein
MKRSNLKHTNTNEFNALVKAYLLPIIEERAADYGETITGNPYAWTISHARAEVGHEFDRHGTQGGLEYWLSGLALGIAFYNSDIVEIAEKWHGVTLTGHQRETITGAWFRFLAVKIMRFAAG